MKKPDRFAPASVTRELLTATEEPIRRAQQALGVLRYVAEAHSPDHDDGDPDASDAINTALHVLEPALAQIEAAVSKLRAKVQAPLPTA